MEPDYRTYAMGIQEIDKSHQKLVHVIETLAEVIGGQGEIPRLVILRLTKEADDFAITHFRQEEDLMLTFGYPMFRDHRGQHDKFFDHLSRLKRLLENEALPKVEVEKFMNFLRNWFKDHIMVTDRKYAEWIQSRILESI